MRSIDGDIDIDFAALCTSTTNLNHHASTINSTPVHKNDPIPP
jgi:hypothetical protein